MATVAEVTDLERARGSLWLVRHGETEWSASGRHTSRTDVPLTEQGRARAAALRRRLIGVGFARVLTSPLRRARDTCGLAGFGSAAEVLDDLREWEYGTDEGRTTAEIRGERPGWSVWAAGPLDGETAAQVGTRADRVIHRVRESDGRTLAFSHGHLSRVLGARWIGLDAADGSRLRLDTAALSVLGWERDRPVLARWNDTGELPR